ncbi:2-dehydropantoate 2-reductase [Streptomyces sp. NPDC005438]|uniref:2-dehydropantoate 2-reductase n=1 Tax=Streptomyces sp. NPDC005438 TaxID=3156880 RepID=UPI0033A94F44
MATSPTSDTTRLAVIGAGSIGTWLAVLADRAGIDTTLCVRSVPESLRVDTGQGPLEPRSVSVVERPEDLDGPVDWVVLTTKAHHTRGAAGWLGALTGPGTVVAAAQNGVDHLERLRPLTPEGTEILPALVYAAVESLAPGRVVHHAGNQVLVPAYSPAAEAFSRLWADTGVRVDAVEDFDLAAWRKLLTNLAANPLTALLGRRMGVFRQPEMAELAGAVLREAVAVGQAEGVGLTEEDVGRTLARYAENPPEGGTSMLYDRLAGRPMEHEHITGPVVRAAARHGLQVPLNSALLTLIRVLEQEPPEGTGR